MTFQMTNAINVSEQLPILRIAFQTASNLEPIE